jgi:hypothetical protein
MKNTLIVASAALVVAAATAVILLRPGSSSEKSAPNKPASIPSPATEKADVKPPSPSMPFNPAEFEPGVGVSERSIERLSARAEELQATRTQLAVKMKSIDERLADPAEAVNAAALREAKQALERSTQQMELEEKALADFLRNERERPATGP